MELELGLALPNHNPTGLDLNSCCTNNGSLDIENGNGVQKVESWSGGRSKSRRLDVNHESDNEQVEEIGGTAAEQTRNSMYVKVKMEGVAIGRKVDLTHYHSYQDLTNTLFHMFAKYSTIDRKRENYILMYQDKEGQWMLVGDIQWEKFMECVQRLEILKDNRMGFRLLSTA